MICSSCSFFPPFAPILDLVFVEQLPHWKFTSRQLQEKQLQRNSHSGWNDTKNVDESVDQCKEGWADG